MYLFINLMQANSSWYWEHGSDEGCYSLALSGGYEDDLDYGVCFTYTGEGDNLTLLMHDLEQQMTSFGPLIGSLQTKHRQNSV